jgi:hypothetical protein
MVAEASTMTKGRDNLRRISAAPRLVATYRSGFPKRSNTYASSGPPVPTAFEIT